jgi:hypothetical protein
MDEKKNFIRLDDLTKTAVAHYWKTRSSQQQKQKERGQADQGLRSAVTGGAQMDGFIELFTDLIINAGLPKEYVFHKRSIELPGYFRPTKEWDLIVVKDGIFVAAIEAKSQVGPSFGNNFNNRTEEAMGTALDLWTAYREGAFLKSPQPFVGYFFMLEDCPASSQPVSVRESHFKVFPEFVGASYLRRYELFCRKLMLERQYTASAFITSDNKTGIEGRYRIPAEDLSLERFVKTLIAHVESVK